MTPTYAQPQSETGKGSRWQFVALLGLALFGPTGLFACCQCAEVLGNWNCSGVHVSVYNDGVASYIGLRATWATIGRDAIRLEYQVNGNPMVAELKIMRQEEGKPRAASLNLGGSEVDCTELPAKEKGEGQ